MKSMIISIITALGAAIAAVATQGCFIVFVDEPEAPRSLIEK